MIVVNNVNVLNIIELYTRKMLKMGNLMIYIFYYTLKKCPACSFQGTPFCLLNAISTLCSLPLLIFSSFLEPIRWP